MNPKDILLLGLKRTVIAYEKSSGQRLWSTQLTSGMGDHFITLLADEKYVFAHTKGELFCLDLISGHILWFDPLKGMGYGLANLALPGGPQSGMGILANKMQEDAAAQANSSDS